jgi:hypothetical protein
MAQAEWERLDMPALDLLYDALPHTWQDRLYERWARKAERAFEAGKDPQESFFSRHSEVYGDAVATGKLAYDSNREYAAQNEPMRASIDVDRLNGVQFAGVLHHPSEQTAHQIMTRGYLAKKADELGVVSKQMIAAIERIGEENQRDWEKYAKEHEKTWEPSAEMDAAMALSREPDEISKQMAELRTWFEFDEIEMRNTYENNVNNGIAPEQTTKEWIADYEKWEKEASRDPRDITAWGVVDHVKNSEHRQVAFSLEEMNYSLGKSEQGYHYALNEFTTMAPDREGHWSEPFPTLEDAEHHAKVELEHAVAPRDYGAEMAAWDWDKIQEETEIAEADEIHEREDQLARSERAEPEWDGSRGHGIYPSEHELEDDQGELGL